MSAIVATMALTLLMWLLNKVCFGQRSAVGAAPVPFLCVAVYQGVGYLTLGYIDPFVWIAVIVQLLISAVTLIALEALWRPAFQKIWNEGTKTKAAVAIVAIFIAAFGMYPWVNESLDQLEIHRTVDRLMLQKATHKAVSVVLAKAALPENYRLETDFNRESNIYEFRFLNQGHLIAVVTLDAVTLEELSVKIEDH